MLSEKFNNVIVTFASPTVLNLLSYNLILHDLTGKTPFHKLSSEDERETFKTISKDSAIRAFNMRLKTMEMLSPAVEEDKQLMAILAAYAYDKATLSKKLSVSSTEKQLTPVKS